MSEWVALAITLLSCILTYLGARRAVQVAAKDTEAHAAQVETQDSATVAQYALALLEPYRQELAAAEQRHQAELAARDQRAAELEARVGHLEAVIREAGLSVPPHYPGGRRHYDH